VVGCQQGPSVVTPAVLISRLGSFGQLWHHNCDVFGESKGICDGMFITSRVLNTSRTVLGCKVTVLSLMFSRNNHLFRMNAT
jgi:hypothetical protein